MKRLHLTLDPPSRSSSSAQLRPASISLPHILSKMQQKAKFLGNIFIEPTMAVMLPYWVLSIKQSKIWRPRMCGIEHQPLSLLRRRLPYCRVRPTGPTLSHSHSDSSLNRQGEEPMRVRSQRNRNNGHSKKKMSPKPYVQSSPKSLINLSITAWE